MDYVLAAEAQRPCPLRIRHQPIDVLNIGPGRIECQQPGGVGADADLAADVGQFVGVPCPLHAHIEREVLAAQHQRDEPGGGGADLLAAQQAARRFDGDDQFDRARLHIVRDFLLAQQHVDLADGAGRFRLRQQNGGQAGLDDGGYVFGRLTALDAVHPHVDGAAGLRQAADSGLHEPASAALLLWQHRLLEVEAEDVCREARGLLKHLLPAAGDEEEGAVEDHGRTNSGRAPGLIFHARRT